MARKKEMERDTLTNSVINIAHRLTNLYQQIKILTYNKHRKEIPRHQAEKQYKKFSEP